MTFCSCETAAEFIAWPDEGAEDESPSVSDSSSGDDPDDEHTGYEETDDESPDEEMYLDEGSECEDVDGQNGDDSDVEDSGEGAEPNVSNEIGRAHV